MSARGVTAALAALSALLATAVFAVLALSAAPAFATLTYPFAGQLAPSGGSFGSLEPSSVAVNDSNDDTYVADSSKGVVDVFDATGKQIASWNGSASTNPPFGTPAGSFGGGVVSVAANNGTGEVYVLDLAHNVVDVFKPSGEYHCQITGSATPSPSECNGAAGSATLAGGLSTPGGIAMDQATGSIYVVDANNGVVDVFSPAGAYVSQISLASIPGGFSALYTRGIAVSDFNGHVYVSDSGTVVVYEFDAAGNYVKTWNGSASTNPPGTPTGTFGAGFLSVAADNTTGLVYVTDSSHLVTDVLGPSGSYVTQFSHSFNFPRGSAVDQGSGKVYVSDNNPGVVDIFGPPPLVPVARTGTASGVAPTSATLSGAVNPRGLPLSDCRFDYGTDTSYGQTAACVPAAASISPDSNYHTVSADLAGLQSGTTYHFRLEASNANGADDFANDVTFATPPRPVIDGVSLANLTANSADLNAQINPKGLQLSDCHFDYGTDASYGLSVPCTPSAGEIPADSSDHPVSAAISELEPNKTYHWRVSATNSNGTTNTPDHTFIYPTSGGGLPDNRAYEMVTPPKKNGALIGDVLFGLGPDLSEDGSHLILSNIQCFGGAESCPANRGLVGTPYDFTRTSSGWFTTPLAPPATQYEINSVWDVNAAAGTALFSIPTPPHGEDDLYARQPDGSLTHIGPVTPPNLGADGPEGAQGLVHRATADFSHVVYEESKVEAHWPFDLTMGSGRSVYEYVGTDNSQPVLVGVNGEPASTNLISTCQTMLGSRGGTGSADDYSLSADGRTVYFTAVGHDVGEVECPASATAPPASELYARIEQSQTVPISRRSPADCTSPECQSTKPGDAEFEGASVDGAKAFFTDTQQLTDTASEDSHEGDTARGSGCSATTGANGCNLYEYDCPAPAVQKCSDPKGHNLLAVSAGDMSGHGPRVQGVMAISSDGSHVYFVAKGVLSAAPNGQSQSARDGAENLYLFERDASNPGGHTTFVATLSSTTADAEQWVNGAGVANVTPDGRFLVFTSQAALTPDDIRADAGPAQVFRYDAQTGTLVRISIGEQGFNDNGNAGVGNAAIAPAQAFRRFAGALIRSDPTMSHDGGYVFFQSPVGLTPQALNDVRVGTDGLGNPSYAQNVYEYRDGHVYLLSDGRDVSVEPSPACQPNISAVCLIGSDASGANVFFTTSDQLVPQDTDTQLDFYDARICTPGDPCIKPAPPSLPPCLGEACHGIPAATPSLLTPGTASFNGEGNITPPPLTKSAPPKRCKRGFVKKHSKCVKRKKSKKARRSAHRAGHNRRATS